MGNDAWTTTARSLVSVAALRRRQAPIRVAMAVALGLGFALELNLPALWIWLGVYVATQAAEQWAIAPFREERPVPPPWRTAVALAAMTLIAAAWGSLAFLMWRLPGGVGPAGAALLLCGGVLNVLTLSRGSAAALAAGATPYLGLMLVLPLSWTGRGPEPLAPAFVLATICFVAAAVVMWRDGEALRRLEQDARRAAEARGREAEQAVEARAGFTAAVSHELRTPLSAILAAAGALEARGRSAEERETAALISDGARLMRRLLDDLLDLAKLEAGRMAVETAGFDLPGLVDETVRFWTPEAAAKGLSLVVQGVEELPRRVEGDALRLRQVLNNVLSNAVKFTARGEVRLELAARREAETWRIRIAVADTGPGLSPDAAARLFRPFEQAAPSTARMHGGTGLGLAISRELARLMGGELSVESRRGGPGARFVLELAVSAAPETSGDRPPLQPPASARVLVVDDHPLGRQALSVLLGLRGFGVRLVEDAAAALAVLEQTDVDLVLTDLHLGEIDGLALVERLRKGGGRNRAAPVVAVTGETRPQVLAAVLAGGFAGVVAKPVEPRALYTAVNSALASGPRASASSLSDSAASSFSSHSQTTATLQPAEASATQAPASRALLRAILASQ